MEHNGTQWNRKIIIILFLLFSFSFVDAQLTSTVFNFTPAYQTFEYDNRTEVVNLDGETLVVETNNLTELGIGNNIISWTRGYNITEIENWSEEGGFKEKKVGDLKDKKTKIALDWVMHTEDLIAFWKNETVCIDEFTTETYNCTVEVLFDDKCYKLKVKDYEIKINFKIQKPLCDFPNEILYFRSHSYIINASGGNQSLLDNGSFYQTRFNRNSEHVELSYEDWDVNNTKLEIPMENNNSKDVSQYENDGTVYGATWCSDCGHDGKGAFVFDGTNDYVDVVDSDSLDITTGKLTITAWINLTGNDVYNSIFYHGGYNFLPDTSTGYQFYAHNGILKAFIGGTGYLSTSGDLRGTGWKYVAVTFSNATTGYFYVDGVQKGSIPAADKTLPSTRPIYIGRYCAGGTAQYFRGMIDDVRIYNRSLSADEILDRYQNGLPYYDNGTANYTNIPLTGNLVNTSTNKTLNGTILEYINDTLECTMTDLDGDCDPSGTYAYNIRLSMELLRGNGTPAFNEITINNGEVACTCATCDECEIKLSDPECNQVNLTADITDQVGYCILSPVDANNKIFNCQGHTIDGDDSGTDAGVYFNARENNTIKNCYIKNFTYGIYLYGASDNTIINNTVNLNRKGIRIYYSSSNNNIVNNTASNNSDSGIALDSIDYDNSPTNNTIVNNTADYNTARGITINNYAINNTIASNTAGFNGVGIYSHTSIGTNITNNSIYSSGNYGLGMVENTNATVTNNSIYNHVEDATLFLRCVNITIENNWVNDSEHHGIVLTDTNYSRIINNTMGYIMYFGGIFLSNSSYNNITNNSCNLGWRGIHLEYGSNNNTIANNTANDNYNSGFSIIHHSNNNTAYGNNGTRNDESFWIHNASFNLIYNNTLNVNEIVGIILSDLATNNTIVNNTSNFNQQSGIALLMVNSSNNTISGNTFCNNNQVETTYTDFRSVGEDNTGDNNTCDTTSNWNDTSDIGCHFLCSGHYCGETLTVNSSLSSNIDCLGDGFIFGVDDIHLNCSGYYVNGSNTGIGINFSGQSDCVIRDCRINDFGWDAWGSVNNFGENNTLFSSYRFRDDGYYIGTFMNQGFDKNYWYFKTLPRRWQHYYRRNLN